MAKDLFLKGISGYKEVTEVTGVSGVSFAPSSRAEGEGSLTGDSSGSNLHLPSE